MNNYAFNYEEQDLEMMVSDSSSEEYSEEEYIGDEFSEDENSEEEHDGQNDNLNSSYIYNNSNIKYVDFVCSFFNLTTKIKISKKSINILLKFIKSILPMDNIIKPSYYMLLKSLNYVKPIKQKICSECYEVYCEHDSLLHNSIDIIKFDFQEELKLILSKYWITILDYMIKLTTKKTSDICSNNSLIQNSVSLILFADGAQFLKSKAGTIWAILAMICNLPPVIRNMFTNILKLIFLHNRSFNFNPLVEKHLLDVMRKLASEGLKISENLTILIYIYGFIADAPARAKCCNSIQFNGEFGCLHCLNPGKLIGKKRVYKGICFKLVLNPF